MPRPFARPVRRSRRGATLVFVAIFSVVLIAIAGFAIDISRLYMGTAELQTAADAGALRGALELQRNAGASPADTARTVIRQNAALGDTAASEVLPAFWTPGSGTTPGQLDTTLTSWTAANAVWVKAARTSGLLFGRLLTSVNPTPRRQAAAWIANIIRTTCPTPWGFPLSALNEDLYGVSDFTPRNDAYQRLESILASPNGALRLTQIFVPPISTTQNTAGTDGAFAALSDRNVNMDTYRDQIANSSSCAALRAITIDSASSFPVGGQGSVANNTAAGANGDLGNSTGGASMCAKPSGQRTADCWPANTVTFTGNAPGVEVVLAWTATPSNSGARILMIGGFRVMCVYSGNANGTPNPNESCGWLDRNRQWFLDNGKPVAPPYGPGTIVGFPVPMSTTLASGTQLGNQPSLAKRLILVR